MNAKLVSVLEEVLREIGRCADNSPSELVESFEDNGSTLEMTEGGAKIVWKFMVTINGQPTSMLSHIKFVGDVPTLIGFTPAYNYFGLLPERSLWTAFNKNRFVLDEHWRSQ